MPKSAAVIFFLCFFSITGLYAQDSIPKNFNEAISYFELHWKPKEKDDFKSKPEESAVIALHKSTGMWIRNTWLRAGKSSALKDYFISLGIDHPDDMSHIILTSLHRKLNNKDIALHRQIEEIKAYWKPIIACEQKEQEIARANYYKFKTGDTVTLYMPVESAGGTANAVIYDCPNTDWVFDPKKDLIIKGTITHHHVMNNSTIFYIKVKIKKLSNAYTTVLEAVVKEGETKEFSLLHLRIE